MTPENLIHDIQYPFKRSLFSVLFVAFDIKSMLRCTSVPGACTSPEREVQASAVGHEHGTVLLNMTERLAQQFHVLPKGTTGLVFPSRNKDVSTGSAADEAHDLR